MTQYESEYGYSWDVPLELLGYHAILKFAWCPGFDLLWSGAFIGERPTPADTWYHV